MIYSTLNKISLKKIHNLEVDNYVLMGGNREFQAWEAAASQVILRKLLQGDRWGDG